MNKFKKYNNKFMKKKIIVIISFFLCWNSFSFNQINLSNYNKLTNILSWKKLNKFKTKQILSTPLSACKSRLNGNNYYVSPSCFLSWWTLPKVNFKETINDILPLISNFKKTYNLNSTWFFYNTATPTFYINYNIDKIIKQNQTNKLLLHILSLLNYYIKIPKVYFEMRQSKNYSFYVSKKNLKLRNKWRLQNLDIAINQLDWYLLKWWKTLNLNNIIANKPWYYKKWNSKYLFYGWVCGASTMLFRNALINPYLYVVKRYNHSQWYVHFYSKYIYWDDAAMYQYIKIFKIKNISKYPIYIRKKQIWNELLLISIIPKRINEFTYISKKQVWKLKAKVSVETMDDLWNIIYKQSWISNYFRKNYEL